MRRVAAIVNDTTAWRFVELANAPGTNRRAATVPAANPVEVAHFNTWDPESSYGSAFEGAVGVRKVGDYVYVADLSRGLIILRELAAN